MTGNPIMAAGGAMAGFAGSRALKTYGPGVGAGLLRGAAPMLEGAGTVLRGSAAPAAGLIGR